MTILEKTNKDK